MLQRGIYIRFRHRVRYEEEVVCRAVERVRVMGVLPTPQLSAGPYGGFELWGHYLPLSCLQGRIEGSSYGGITYPSAVCRVVWRGPVVGVLPTPQLYAGPYGGVQLWGHYLPHRSLIF